MGTEYSDRGGWFSDSLAPTGSPSKLTCISRFVVTAGFIISMGTGVFADDLSLLKLASGNKCSTSSPFHYSAVDPAYARTAIEDVQIIRDIFGPAVSDLAKCFPVSRQTIYNWLSGEQPTQEHEAKLRHLALAADILAESGYPVTGNLLKRRIFSGKNMIEVIQDGGSPIDTAQRLLQIVKHEAGQREILSARFAGRPLPQSSPDSDLMPENDKA
jgi:transcriptional regulator with XRE-family HTH domain